MSFLTPVLLHPFAVPQGPPNGQRHGAGQDGQVQGQIARGRAVFGLRGLVQAPWLGQVDRGLPEEQGNWNIVCVLTTLPTPLKTKTSKED